MNIKYKLLILGMGNILMSDDGVGVFIAEELTKTTLPTDILILEIGTSAINYLTEISNSTNVIIIDAMCAGQPPGTIYHLRDTDNIPNTSSEIHELSILSVIQQAKLLTGLPTTIDIYGIEPYTLEFGIGLSPIVQATIPKVINIVRKMLANPLHN